MTEQPNQPQGLQIAIQDVMKDFARRKAAGSIRWNTNGEHPVLEVDVFDVAGTKQPEPVRMAFSSKQIERILLDYDTQIIQHKRQVIDMQERLDALESERDNVYGTLKNELKALESKQPKA